MKRTIKKGLRSLWRLSAPVRTPLVRKFDSHAMLLLRQIPQPQIPQPPGPPADLDLVLNSMVRELARLQMQIELLQQQVEDLSSNVGGPAHPESRLAVVAEMG
jgi:hypothetical protein